MVEETRRTSYRFRARNWGGSEIIDVAGEVMVGEVGDRGETRVVARVGVRLKLCHPKVGVGCDCLASGEVLMGGGEAVVAAGSCGGCSDLLHQSGHPKMAHGVFELLAVYVTFQLLGLLLDPCSPVILYLIVGSSRQVLRDLRPTIAPARVEFKD